MLMMYGGYCIYKKNVSEIDERAMRVKKIEEKAHSRKNFKQKSVLDLVLTLQSQRSYFMEFVRSAQKKS